MRQQTGRTAELLADGTTANLPPMSVLAGVSMADLFPDGIRQGKYIVMPKLALNGVKAELDLDTPSADLDTVVRAKYAGTGGNSITVAAAADGTNLTKAFSILTLAANATRANAIGTLTLAGNATRANSVGTFTLAGNPTNEKASLDLATKTTNCDTVIQAAAAGADGNSTTIAFVADGTGAGTLDEGSFPAIVFHYETTVTTVADFEAAVAGSTNLEVKTSGTGGNALVAVVDAFSATALAGGTTETVTMGAKTYLFEAVLTNVANNVLIGATASDTLDNLIAAVNGDTGSGTLYAAATVASTEVFAEAGAGDTMVVTAQSAGVGGDSIATTTDAADGSWGDVTLQDGAVAESVTIKGIVYRFVNYLNAANQVLIGATASDTIDNLIAAINAGAGSGTLYGAGTTANAYVSAAAGAGDTMIATAKLPGLVGNTYDTTETMASGSWGSGGMLGGAVAETVSIGGRAYSLVNYLTAADQVLIGATASDTLDNLIAAINTDAGAGTLYGTGTTDNAHATAAAGAGDTMRVEHLSSGSAYNGLVAVAETMASGSWSTPTLTGGTDFSGVTITENALTKAVTIHYVDGVSTVEDVEGAITASSTLIEVKTTGTIATVLDAADAFTATALAGGTNVAVSGIFTLWGLIDDQWMVASKINGGSAVAGNDPYAAAFPVEDLGCYSRLYLEAATLTGTAGATLVEVCEVPQ